MRHSLSEETLSTPVGVHVSVPTIDMASGVRFYVDILGLTVVSESDDLTQLTVGGDRISLKRVSLDSVSLQRAATEIRARHFGFRIESIEALGSIARAVEYAGHYVVQEISERGDELTFFCLDPSGNQVELYYEGPARSDP